MLRIRLLHDSDGEPRIWSHGINESAKKRPGAWPREGRWWLHFPRNEIGLEWHLFSRNFGASVRFDDTSDYDVMLWVAIPFLMSVYIMFGRVKWLLRLLGLTYEQTKDKPLRDWRRELGFSWHHGALWIDPWCNSHEWSRSVPKWRQNFSIDPVRILFGRRKYTKYDERVDNEAVVVMPEGYYPAEVTLYIAQWKRPRWPLATRIYRAEVEVEGGIPVPGKGENSWDLDDDAIFSLTTQAKSAGEATKKMYESAMRSRERHANVAWVPDAGWPEHCKTRY